MDAAWLTSGRFAALLGGLILASYPGVLLGRETFVFRDFGLYGYPVARFFRECFWRGELPLWNPLNNCGIPFLAQWSTLVLYPLSLFYLLLPLSWSLGVFCLLHLFLAGLGMYFLAFRWTEHRLAASVAGIAFAFNGYVINCLMWPHCMVVWAWMPWVVYAAERAWQEGGRRIIVAGVVGALQMLGGVPEWILLTWIVTGALWLGQWMAGKGQRRIMLGRLLLVMLLVAGLTAAQLLPFFDLLRYSQRDTRFAASDWAMPGTGWANLLVPLFRCFKSSAGVYFEIEQHFTSSYYAGIAVLALAIWAGLWVKQPRVRLLAVTALLGLVLAMGDDGFLYGGLRGIFPQLGFMRYPIKLLMLTTLAIPLLASFAVCRLSRPDSKHWPALAGLGLVLMAAIGFLLWFSRAYHDPGETRWPLIAKNGAWRVVFLIAILAILYLTSRWCSGRRHDLLALGLIFGLWLDFQTHVPDQNPVVTRSVYEPGLPTLAQLNPRPRLGESRAMLRGEAYNSQMTKLLADPRLRFVSNRLWLFMNSNLLDDVPKVDGFYSLYLRETDRLGRSFFSSTMKCPAPMADFLGVSQITDMKRDLEWEARPTFMPFVTVGQKPLFVAPAELLSRVLQTTFDPRHCVYLPAELQSLVTVTNETDARILTSRFSAQRIGIEVASSAQSMVVVSQSYYHNWRAYVDDQRAPLWRANYAFQALTVPAGRHHVILAYEDWAFRMGACISLAAVVTCVVAWRRMDRRRQSGEAKP